MQFTGFHSNLGKTFVGFASSVLKVPQRAFAHKIHRENFRVLSKIHENRKHFCRSTFIVYGKYTIYVIMHIK